MLEIDGIHKAYRGRAVLRGVDLTVPAGQVLGLLGANGAGKTTLISIATGLRRPDAGTVRVAGIDVLRDRRRAAVHIGLAPQELGLYPTLTVARNLAFAARLAGVRRSALHRRIDEVASALGLTSQLRQRADELSGGQKRRLHAGMALLHRPGVLFLDEPTVGADVPSRAGILDIVRSMAADGTAIVYTTHHLTELESLGAHIAVLDGGRLVAQGPLAAILDTHATAGVGLSFVGTPPALPGWRAEGTRLVPVAAVTDPAAVAARALADLGPYASTLVGVEVTRPSLESAYLSITGTHLTPAPTSTPTPTIEENPHVAVGA